MTRHHLTARLSTLAMVWFLVLSVCAQPAEPQSAAEPPTEPAVEPTAPPTAEYESGPTFKASEILAEMPEMLSGEHFKVREEVPNDGYWDFYTIDTPFGVFQAHGWIDLRTTLREIEAIALIESVARTDVFAKAAIEKGLEPLEVARQIITHPVQTVKNIPGGIKQMFQRYARRAKQIIEVGEKLLTGSSEAKQSDPRLAEACAAGDEPYPGACDEEGYADDFKKLARRYFDVDDEMREFHMELGTDPYSSNEVLQNAVKSVAWVGGLGQFGVKKLNPLVRVQAIGVAGRVHKYAWALEPFELRAELDKRMIEAGIPQQDRQYFLNNPFMTPTKQTFIVLALWAMKGVEGREHILHWAADSRNEDEALYSMASVALAQWFHELHPAKRFLPDAVLPVLELHDGRIVTLLPIDHLSWTEEVATIVEAAMMREELRAGQPKVVWLLARASDLARQQMEDLGITVIQDGYKELLATGEELEFDELPEDWRGP